VVESKLQLLLSSSASFIQTAVTEIGFDSDKVNTPELL